MNKTASLIIRLVAIAGAIGAGAAWYLIQTQQIDVAMNKSEWLTSDSEISAGKEFPARMNALDTVKTVLEGKRTQIKDLTAQKQSVEATLQTRDKTIDSQKSEIAGLEAERVALVRTREEMKGQVQEATSKNLQLQGELDKATSTIARQNEQIATMFSRDQFNEQVDETNKAIDGQQKAFAGYSRLRNWIMSQGIKPPFNADPTKAEGIAGNDEIPTPEIAAEVKTQILTIDRRAGLLSISLGVDDNVRENQIFAVKVDGKEIGKIKLTDVRSGLSVAAILPETQHQLLARESIITLVRQPLVTITASAQ